MQIVPCAGDLCACPSLHVCVVDIVRLSREILPAGGSSNPEAKSFTMTSKCKTPRCSMCRAIAKGTDA